MNVPIEGTPEAFKKRRLLNVIVVGLMYAFFYSGRYNFSAAHATIAEQFGWQYTDYGIILMSGMIAYAVSVLFNGSITDKIGGRVSLLIGAVGTAFFNFIFGLCSFFLLTPAQLAGSKVVTPAILSVGMSSSMMISMMAAIWAFNHFFQSFGALSITKINSTWVNTEERGRFAGWFGILIQAGRLMAFCFCPLTLLFFDWQYVFWIPSVLILIAALLCYTFVRNTPEELGYNGHIKAHEDDEHTGEVSILQNLKKIFWSKTMWMMASISICLGFGRHVIDHWMPMYFTKMFHIPAKQLFTFGPYILVAIAMPIMMVLGGITSGFASDLIFNARRAPVLVFGFIGQALCLTALYYGIHSPWIAAICLIFTFFWIQGCHTIISGTMTMDFGGKKATGTATSLIDGMQYLVGSIVGGWGVGKVLEHYKSNGAEFKVWPLLPIPMTLVGVALAARLWHAKPGKKLS